MNNVVCKNCRKEPAFYLRPYSGEFVCKQCLRKGLVKQVRKTLSYYPIVKRRERVIYVIRLDRPAESIAFLKIFKNFVKRLDLDMHLVVPEELRPTIDKHLERLMKVPNIVDVSYIHITRFEPQNFVELIKLHEVLSLSLSSEIGSTTVLMPLFREELVFLALLGLVKASRTIFGDSFPVKQWRSLKVSRPSYLVSLIDMIAYVYTDPDLLELMDSVPNTVFFDTIEKSLVETLIDVAYSSKELVYASRKSVELMQSMFISSPARCRLCLSFTEGGEICDICNYLF